MRTKPTTADRAPATPDPQPAAPNPLPETTDPNLDQLFEAARDRALKNLEARQEEALAHHRLAAFFRTIRNAERAARIQSAQRPRTSAP